MQLISEYRNDERSAEVYYNPTSKRYIAKCYDSLAPNEPLFKHLTDGLRYGYRTQSQCEDACEDWVSEVDQDA